MLKHSTPASGCDFANYLLTALGIQIHRHHRRPFPREAQGSTATDSAGCSGDYRDFSV
jgi:hypothetical protein